VGNASTPTDGLQTQAPDGNWGSLHNTNPIGPNAAPYNSDVSNVLDVGLDNPAPVDNSAHAQAGSYSADAMATAPIGEGEIEGQVDAFNSILEESAPIEIPDGVSYTVIKDDGPDQVARHLWDQLGGEDSPVSVDQLKEMAVEARDNAIGSGHIIIANDEAAQAVNEAMGLTDPNDQFKAYDEIPPHLFHEGDEFLVRELPNGEIVVDHNAEGIERMRALAQGVSQDQVDQVSGTSSSVPINNSPDHATTTNQQTQRGEVASTTEQPTATAQVGSTSADVMASGVPGAQNTATTAAEGGSTVYIPDARGGAAPSPDSLQTHVPGHENVSPSATRLVNQASDALKNVFPHMGYSADMNNWFDALDQSSDRSTLSSALHSLAEVSRTTPGLDISPTLLSDMTQPDVLDRMNSPIIARNAMEVFLKIADHASTLPRGDQQALRQIADVLADAIKTDGVQTLVNRATDGTATATVSDVLKLVRNVQATIGL